MDFARSAGYPSLDKVGPLGVTRSLAIEEHFYLLWPPALMFLLNRRSLRQVAWVCLLVALAAWLGLVGLCVAGLKGNSLYFHPELRSAALFVGCGAALLADLVPRRILLSASYVAAIALLLALQFSRSNSALTTFAGTMPLAWTCTAMLLVAISQNEAGHVGRLLSLRPWSI